MSQPEIFVSYAWKGESEDLVTRLCGTFAAKGYTIMRDKSALAYRDSIKNFMDSIGRGNFVIAVINDKYMKSEYCMYEACRMLQSPAFRARVYPIVLTDADIFSMRGQITYLKYWETEYQVLETEYKQLAASSPTMVAPLAERLRDMEVTTRFINDFMAAVGDMNVLTSQIHLETNFSVLIQAIEARMKSLEPRDSEENQTQEAKMTDEKKIGTGGGAYIGGNVNTGGGDFVGRDKKVTGNETKISVGGSVSGSNIVVGNNNVVTNTISTHNIFAPVYQAIEKSPRPIQEKEDLKADVTEIEAAVAKGEAVDEPWLSRKLRTLKRMAPDIAEVALSALAGPSAVVATIVKLVAEKVKAE